MAEKQMKNETMKTGALLVREGLIRREEIDNALSIQSVEAAKRKVPLGRILVKKGLVSKTQILELAQHPLVLEGAVKLALEKGLITPEQLEKASAISLGGRTPGECLTAQGHLSVEALKRLVIDLLGSRQLAGYLTALSLVSTGEIRGVLETFEYPQSIGGILCGMNLVDPGTLYHLLARHGKLMKLGELLVLLFGIHRQEVEKALSIQKNGSSKPLGGILVENNVITEEQLNMALSRQCNLLFKNLGAFSFTDRSKTALSGVVTAEVAAAGAFVPVQLDGSILTTAVSVPACLLSMERFSAENPFLRVKSILVGDRKFRELFSSLYGSDRRVSPHEVGKRLVEAAGAVSRKTDTVSESSPDVVPGRADASRGIDALAAGSHTLPLNGEPFCVGEEDPLAVETDFHEGTDPSCSETEKLSPLPDAVHEEAKIISDGIEALSAGLDALCGDTDALAQGEDSLSAGLEALCGDTDAPAHGEDALSAGVDALCGETDAPAHGEDALSAGLDAFYGGVESIIDGIGAGKLSDDLPACDVRVPSSLQETQGESVTGMTVEEFSFPPSGRDMDAAAQQAEPEIPIAAKDEKDPSPVTAENGHHNLAGKNNVVFLPVMEMEISDPENEGILIERMYRGYESLKGGEVSSADLSMFRDFIRDNHKRICDTFLCSTVTFNIESYGEKVMIQATPGRIG